MAPGQATFPGRADTPRSPASRATKRSRLRARCCYRCLHSGQLGVAALRPSERPRRPPRRPGWVLHTVQFPIPVWLYRITRVAHPNPAYYGRARTFRFDAPDGSYGVCYFGTSLAAAFMETVPLALIPHSGDRLVESTDLNTRYASLARSNQPL